MGFDDHNAYLIEIGQGYEMYVVCYMLLDVYRGQVDAILGVYVDHSGVTWVYLGAILGNVGAILGPLWEVWGVLGSTLELRV